MLATLRHQSNVSFKLYRSEKMFRAKTVKMLKAENIYRIGINPCRFIFLLESKEFGEISKFFSHLS